MAGSAMLHLFHVYHSKASGSTTWNRQDIKWQTTRQIWHISINTFIHPTVSEDARCSQRGKHNENTMNTSLLIFQQQCNCSDSTHSSESEAPHFTLATVTWQGYYRCCSHRNCSRFTRLRYRAEVFKKLWKHFPCYSTPLQKHFAPHPPKQTCL